MIEKPFRESPAGSGTSSAETAPIHEAVDKDSDSLSSSSSNCLAQADSHSRGFEDRTDQTMMDHESMISSPARFSVADG